MQSIAFIGLGVMGRPMAMNLLAAGYEVVSYKRGGSPDRDFVAAGGSLAASGKDAAEGADIVITMLPDSPDVLEVALGDDGVLAGMNEGAIFVDMSTIRPDVSRRLWDVGQKAGIRVLDAPVSGGEAAAVAGSLSVMVGGERADFELVREVLDVLGSTVRHVGAPGSGQVVKAANQLIVAGNIQLVAEALVFLEASGVDTSVALDVIGGGLAGSAVIARRGPAMLERNFKPGFRVDLHHKDLGILADSARAVGVPLPLGAAVTQLMAALRAGGGGGLDHTALLLLMEMMSGRVETTVDDFAERLTVD